MNLEVQSYKFNNLEITVGRQGAIYLSPLKTSRHRYELMRRFVGIKSMNRLPTYLYLIQRL